MRMLPVACAVFSEVPPGPSSKAGGLRNTSSNLGWVVVPLA